MVLVKVCEAVVEENGRLDGFRDSEAQDAHVCFERDARLKRVVLAAPSPHGRWVGIGFERRGDSAGRNGFELVFGRGVEVGRVLAGRGGVAVCVVD